MPDTSAGGRMAAIAVYPGKAQSLHLTSLPRTLPGPDEVRVRVRRVGVCGTDREIIAGKYGRAPSGSDELVIGHESLGVVDAVGDGVSDFKPGDLVAAMVRRPDGCPCCRAGQPDMCLWGQYTERGIVGANGYMVEHYIEHPRYLVKVPAALEEIGVLVEPLTVVEKAVRQADLIQRRIVCWDPKTAIVLGAGPVGLLGTLLLRSRGVNVHTLARTLAPNPAAAIVAGCGGHYVSTRETPLAELARSLPNVDLILEATGVSALAFAAMSVLGVNGVLVLLSVTSGEGTLPVPADQINHAYVLGNKVTVGSVNAAHEDFVSGVTHLGTFERLWPGLTAHLITARLRGFDEYAQIGQAASEGIKTVVEFPSA